MINETTTKSREKKESGQILKQQAMRCNTLEFCSIPKIISRAGVNQNVGKISDQILKDCKRTKLHSRMFFFIARLMALFPLMLTGSPRILVDIYVIHLTILQIKLSTARTLYSRADNIINKPEHKSAESDHINQTLQNNGFPMHYAL